MVFSRQCKSGRAKVVPCRSTANDLVAEAECLWAAERNGPSNHRISASWGRVALLCHPGRDAPRLILNAWAARVRQEPGYADVPQADGEGPLISKDGILQIEWPILVESDQAVPLDILLATATCPSLLGTPPQYPDARRIAEAWRNDTQGNISYFRNNRAHGIQTFEDPAIEGLL